MLGISIELLTFAALSFFVFFSNSRITVNMLLDLKNIYAFKSTHIWCCWNHYCHCYGAIMDTVSLAEFGKSRLFCSTINKGIKFA